MKKSKRHSTSAGAGTLASPDGVGWAGSFTGVDATGYRFEPVTAQRGADLAAFSRRHGKFGYCSCMRWRLPSAQFRELGRDGRAAALGELASAGRPVGVLAYQDQDVVGWCSIAPREDYAAVLASRVIPRLPGEGVWSVTCFFVAPQARHRGAAGTTAGSCLRVRRPVRCPHHRGLPVAGRGELPVHGHSRPLPRRRVPRRYRPGRLPPRHAVHTAPLNPAAPSAMPLARTFSRRQYVTGRSSAYGSLA